MSESDVISSSTPKRATRKRATTKRATVKRATRKVATRKRAPAREVADDTPEVTRPVSRKAPTEVASERASYVGRKQASRKRSIIVLVLMVLTLGGSLGLGISDPGVINVSARIEERNIQIANGEYKQPVGETETAVSVPVQKTAPTVPNAGLRGMGQPAPPPPPPKPVATTTASSTDDGTASTTPDGGDTESVEESDESSDIGESAPAEDSIDQSEPATEETTETTADAGAGDEATPPTE